MQRAARPAGLAKDGLAEGDSPRIEPCFAEG
jgi:hypothetical protein